MHELTGSQAEAVKNCVYTATRNGEDPWVVCENTTYEEAGVPPLDLFNGVATHFLSECPGRTFAEAGAVCVPNIFARTHFPLQVLSRMAAMVERVWDEELQCLNAVCHLVPRYTCYVRLATFFFEEHLDEKDGDVNGTSYNGAALETYETPPASGSTAAIMFNREEEQYVATGPLPWPLENTTIEAWVTIDDVERITNVALDKHTVADIEWKVDYMPNFATDGDLDTYWSSQLSPLGQFDMSATFIVDLEIETYAGQIIIFWKHPAADFKVSVSSDNVTWTQLTEVIGNGNLETVLDTYFKGRWVNVTMTRAAAVRPDNPPGAMQPVISIKEIQVILEDNLSRLKPTLVTNVWAWPVGLAIDGDLNTFWAMPPNTNTADLFVDFGSAQDVFITRIIWRYPPREVVIYYGVDPCDVATPYLELANLVGPQVMPEFTLNLAWTGQCIMVRILETRPVYGRNMAAVKEVEAFQEAMNLAPGATVAQVIPIENRTALYAQDPDVENVEPGWLTPIANAMDGNPNTWWLVQPLSDGTCEITLDLGAAYMVMSIDVVWAEFGGDAYRASRFYVLAGLRQDSMNQVDEVIGYSERRRKVVIFQETQFVQLQISEVMWSNPHGRVGVEDLMVYLTSDNIGNRTASTANATSEWADCSDCTHVVDGALRTHGVASAVDGRLDTWWGLPFDPPIEGDEGWDTWYFEVHLPQAQRIDLLAVRWRYPAQDIRAFCQESDDTRMDPVITIPSNYAYKTPIPFIGGRLCKVVRLLLVEPLEIYAGMQITGITEFEMYDLTLNYALRQPVTTSDGTDARLAVDSSDVTKWSSAGNLATYVTVDLGSVVTAWGARVLFPSNQVARDFSVLISNDSVSFHLVERIPANEESDIYVIDPIVARYARCYFPGDELVGGFSLRTFAILGGPNRALNQVAIAPNTWFYNGFEAVDGIDDTFWVSEPLASAATIKVDLAQDYFIGGGVSISWMYPPEEFSVYISRDDITWDLLHYSNGNFSSETSIWGWFEARYVELRMHRASVMSDDGIYGVRSIDVMFDPNLAHWKYVNVTHFANATEFGDWAAADNNLTTFWMPLQGSDQSTITFDLEFERGISGYEIHWRRQPHTFRVEREVNGVWYLVRQYGNPTGPVQEWQQGFIASRIRIRVEQALDQSEGMIVALRELLLWVSDEGTNIAAYRPVNYSHFEVLGNPPSAAVDMEISYTYWKPFASSNTPGTRRAWIIIIFDTPPPNTIDDRPGYWTVARVQIYWRWLPLAFQVETFYDTTWTMCGDETDQSAPDMLYTLNVVEKATYMRITIEGDSTDMGIRQVFVQTAIPLVPPRVEPGRSIWYSPAGAMIDHDMQTYWMSRSHENQVVIWVDLFRVYVAEDIRIRFGFRDQGFDLFSSVDGLGAPRDGINQWVDQDLTSTPTPGLKRLRNHGVAFHVRYLQLHIVKGYQDEEYMFGTSIRDVAVILFRNMAKWKVAAADSIWNYPTSWAVDGDNTTMWLSRHGVTSTYMIVDLTRPTNIAGIHWYFGFDGVNYGAARFQLLQSFDGVNWDLTLERTGNSDLEIVIPDTLHFQARYIKLALFEPITPMFEPDNFGNLAMRAPVFSVIDFEVYEHTGGGAAFGLQSLDGMEYTSVAYGLRQPGQWIIASEHDRFTQDFEGGGNVEAEDLGTEVQLVITLRNVGALPGNRLNTQVILYRNGVMYGNPYTLPLPRERLSQAGQTRLVFGARSTAHDNSAHNGTYPNGDPRDGVEPHGRTHSPFFQGRVSRAALFQGALSPEEVRGVYERVALGGPELGCHCYDACATGFNRFFPDVPIPCSGQGVCLRAWSEDASASGYCQCQPGFSGEACENHCSDLSVYGCCEVDDDCPEDVPCNEDTKACAE
jgi:hypothetical protein